MIEIIFITAFIVLAFHVFTWEGMVFESVANALYDLPDYFKKPLYDCPICMAIWWGPSIVACGIIGCHWKVDNVFALAIIVTSAAGINAVLIYLISSNREITKELKDKPETSSDKELKDETNT